MFEKIQGQGRCYRQVAKGTTCISVTKIFSCIALSVGCISSTPVAGASVTRRWRADGRIVVNGGWLERREVAASPATLNLPLIQRPPVHCSGCSADVVFLHRLDVRMEVVEIPTTALLEEMLKKLCLPSPKYKTYEAAEAKLIAPVTFYPKTRCIGFTYGSMSLSSCPMHSLKAANNDAAKQVIKYMEKTGQKVPKHYNYEETRKTRLRIITSVADRE